MLLIDVRGCTPFLFLVAGNNFFPSKIKSPAVNTRHAESEKRLSDISEAFLLSAAAQRVAQRSAARSQNAAVKRVYLVYQCSSIQFIQSKWAK